MKILIEGTPKEIAAFVLEIQERQSESGWIVTREPYQRHRTLVRTGSGQDSSFEDK